MTQSYDFLVGTFNTPQLYTLRFTPPSSPSSSPTGSVKIVNRASAIGSHSWLHLSPPKGNGVRNLYATAWTEPPSVVAYAVNSATDIQLLGSAATRSRSGYVTANDVAVYSAGGATGEVFSLDRETGNFSSPSVNGAETNGHGGAASIRPLQDLSFVDTTSQRDDGSVMDFGGLRHGAHSTDLSPSGRALYVADIGRNCIWTFAVDASTGKLTLGEKHISPRPNDGPRHVWPHPRGNVVYSLQEHTSMVDVFATTDADGVILTHEQGVRIIPRAEQEGDFWADEVRTSLSNGDAPRYLYASTRGLEKGKKGYVAVYKLNEDGRIDTSSSATTNGTTNGINGTNGTNGTHNHQNEKPYAGLLCMYETATSGGWANAIQPGPTIQGVEYLALTDSEEGWVFVLSWDGVEIKEVARVRLDEGAGAATAVWL